MKHTEIRRYNKVIRSNNFIIRKISNPTKGEKEADGLTPGGDRSNGYAWAMAESNNYIYIGSNRNIIYGVIKSTITDENLATALTKVVFKGDVPTDNNDNAAEIYRYNKRTKEIEFVYKSELTPEGLPYESGYRSAIAFTAANETEENIYIGAFGSKYTRILKFKKNYNVSTDLPEVVFLDTTGTSSIRAMSIHNNKLYFGLMINDTDLRIMESSNPSQNSWNIVADLKDFNNIPNVDSGSAGAGGIFDLISYNGYLYAFIGSGTKDISESGFLVFKGKYVGSNTSGVNNYGWKWNMIVGPDAKYEAGMGVPYYAIATPFKYRSYDGKEYVYVGTFSNVLQALKELTNFNFKYLYKNFVKPTQLYRFDKKDNWEMVVGSPSKVEPIKTRLGNYKAGFVPEYSRTNYSSNHYIWRMAKYNGKLFLGTFDSSTLYDYLIPKRIPDHFDDFEDLLKLVLEFLVSLNKITSSESESILAIFNNHNNYHHCNKFTHHHYHYYDDYNNESIDLNILKPLKLFLPNDIQADIDSLLSNSNFSANSNSNVKSNNKASANAENQLEALISKIKDFFSSQDFLKQIYYMRKIRIMLDNSVKGFNLYVSKDGINFDKINSNGFFDSFNYGLRTFLSSSDGLYIGTANPFYGAQLWKLTEYK